MFSFIHFNFPFKIPIFLLFSLILLLIIRILIKKGSTDFYKSINNFLERENKANLITKNLENLNLNYVKVTENMLPFKNYELNQENKNLIKFQEVTKRKLSLKMLNFNKYLTNTELKELYGINNLEKISLYEEHFKGFIISLYDWAFELYNKNNLTDAKIILNLAISLNADISKIYTLLADIYLKENNFKELEDLKDKVNNSAISIKSKTLDYINKLI